MGVVLLVVGLEYVARHVVAPSLPVIAERRVNDMLCSGVVYALMLAVFVRTSPAPAPRGGWLSTARQWQVWVGLSAVVMAVALSLLDRALWGAVALPSYVRPWRDTVLFRGAQWLGPAVLLAVNGILVPVSEERVWRGFVQPRMAAGLGSAVGIGVTAALFSAKHVVVDASPARALMITGMGIALGWVASTTSWRGSALVHAIMNLTATALSLLVARPTCPVPPVEVRPEVRRAMEQAVSQMASPDDASLRALFAPSYLAHFPQTRSFLEGAHRDYGACSLRCTVKEESARKATALLDCESGPRFLTIGLEREPSARVNYFTLKSELDR